MHDSIAVLQFWTRTLLANTDLNSDSMDSQTNLLYFKNLLSAYLVKIYRIGCKIELSYDAVHPKDARKR